MTGWEIVADLAGRGVTLTLRDGSIDFDGAAGTITEADVDLLRQHKQEIIAELEDEIPAGWLETPEGGLIRADFADDWPEDVDPDTVPVCPGCSRYCDTETGLSEWRCSRCDETADKRKQTTLQWLNHRARIQAGRGRRSRR